MLRNRSIEIAQEQRRQRRALVLFLAALLALLGLCAIMGMRMLAPPTPLIAAGRIEDFMRPIL